MPKKDEHFSVFSFKGCFLIFIIIFVLFGIGAGITIAKTGLLDIPILSKAIYKPTEPTREIITSQNVDVKKIISSKSSSLKSAESTIKITFSEIEATSLLRSQLLDMQDDEFSIDNAQIVFLDDAIEVFAEISDPREAVVKIVIEPHIANGELDVKIRDIDIGGLDLPSFIPNLVISTLLEGKLAEAEKILSESPIKEVQIIDGEMSVVIDPSEMR